MGGFPLVLSRVTLYSRLSHSPQTCNKAWWPPSLRDLQLCTDNLKPCLLHSVLDPHCLAHSTLPTGLRGTGLNQVKWQAQGTQFVLSFCQVSGEGREGTDRGICLDVTVKQCCGPCRLFTRPPGGTSFPSHTQVSRAKQSNLRLCHVLTPAMVWSSSTASCQRRSDLCGGALTLFDLRCWLRVPPKPRKHVCLKLGTGDLTQM